MRDNPVCHDCPGYLMGDCLDCDAMRERDDYDEYDGDESEFGGDYEEAGNGTQV